MIRDMTEALILDHINKSFAHGATVVTAVDNVSLTLHPNEFFTLLGPSGCGKTTLLRLVAGLDTADSGKIILFGQDITGLPACQRPVNTVFQNYALFPHMTVAENIGFGLLMQGKDKNTIAAAVKEALQLVRLETMSDRKPAQLSGGQQQRVALARALVNHPQILLLDESLSALDHKLRKEMQIELKRLQRDTGITFIFVTHDQDEALSMSDRIAVMDKGRVVQLGTPQDIYDRPATRFVADFIGNCNFVRPETLGLAKGREVGFRPEDIFFVTPEEKSSCSATGTVAQINYRGSVTHYIVRLDSGDTVTVCEDEPLPLKENERVRISIAPERLIRCAS
ncbi:MAG: ATP-binding cassette domain-containing protein [Alphaproteobacteria bacterium]|nr:ATP-binding cassette domain-containing protein [Alphaproteobacteria bacterium]